MTFGTDDIDEGLLDSVGAVRLLDKMDLADQLVPAILERKRGQLHNCSSELCRVESATSKRFCHVLTLNEKSIR